MAMVINFKKKKNTIQSNKVILYQTVKLPTVPIDNDIETHDKVFNSLLVHSYHMFRLFMGTMTSALKVSDQPEEELEQLKLRAAYFYSKVSSFTLNQELHLGGI
jgi:hypothetical protein